MLRHPDGGGVVGGEGGELVSLACVCVRVCVCVCVQVQHWLTPVTAEEYDHTLRVAPHLCIPFEAELGRLRPARECLVCVCVCACVRVCVCD